MKIGELAKRSGLAPSRIRFYEASGLIQGVQRQGNGYREYGPEALWTLELISSAQCAGFSLDEIRTLLPDHRAQWQPDELVANLERKLAEIEAMQQRLATTKRKLQVAIKSVKTAPRKADFAERAQWMMEQLRAGV
jgi:DNA-binding transcriptional MerR regulator